MSGDESEKEVVLVTLRELHEDTAGVLERIAASGKPGLVTRHGLFVAMIAPLPPGIEGRLLEADPGFWAQIDEAEARLAAGTADTVSLDDLERQLEFMVAIRAANLYFRLPTVVEYAYGVRLQQLEITRGDLDERVEEIVNIFEELYRESGCVALVYDGQLVAVARSSLGDGTAWLHDYGFNGSEQVSGEFRRIYLGAMLADLSTVSLVGHHL
jgi:antitoxin (DNA-binding transcriptional repressor) of toxin-antitoxin stability system